MTIPGPMKTLDEFEAEVVERRRRAGLTDEKLARTRNSGRGRTPAKRVMIELIERTAAERQETR